MLIVVCGMHRSGSTLQYQIAAALCESQGPLTRFTGWKDTSVEASQDPAGRHIVKIHWPARMLERKLNPANVRYLYSYRDVRDVLASFIAKGEPMNEELARKTVQEEIAAFRVFTNRRHVLVTQYEEFVADISSLVDAIGAFLSIPVSADLRHRLSEDLQLDRQRHRVNQLMKTTEEMVLSRESLLTRNHVGDARIGKWKEILSPELRRISDELAGDWLRENGYA